MIEQKSISTIDKFLGQFMTPEAITDSIVSDVCDGNVDCIFIEPSFGTGNFIKSLIRKDINESSIIGVEFDERLFKQANLNLGNLHNINFYDFTLTFTNKHVHFIGNVPFRTPALSLRTHKKEIKRLSQKYDVKGIREEAVFFILKTLEIIETSFISGRITYIIPKNLLTTNSKFFKTFHNLLESKFRLVSIKDMPKNIFDGAVLDTCLLDIIYDPNNTNKYLSTSNTNEYWTFNDIFVRTYLGSVPCESIFLSAPAESMNEFKNRLVKLYTEYPYNVDVNIRNNKGMAHLKVLNGENKTIIKEKLKVIHQYLSEIKNQFGDTFTNWLLDDNNYKQINHRHEIRYYFREPRLKKLSFVYEINPNPAKSFYFTGNPSTSSTDYFGFCEYDITRNSSPGACRTIPIDSLSDNLTNEFKVWWSDTFPNKSYDYLFEIFLKTHNSEWYKNMKSKHKRFYFGIPSNLQDLQSILKNAKKAEK